MAENDDKPLTKGDFVHGMNQLGTWMNNMERALKAEIKKLQDEVSALQGQIAHLDK